MGNAVHNSQGLTSEKAVINGLYTWTFICGSVTGEKLLGLLFKTSFPISHLQKLRGSSGDLDTDTECCRYLALGPLLDINLTAYQV
jgi:hypothetical protein